MSSSVPAPVADASPSLSRSAYSSASATNDARDPISAISFAGSDARVTGAALSFLRPSSDGSISALTPAACVDPPTDNTDNSPCLIGASELYSVGHELFLTSHSLQIDYVLFEASVDVNDVGLESLGVDEEAYLDTRYMLENHGIRGHLGAFCFTGQAISVYGVLPSPPSVLSAEVYDVPWSRAWDGRTRTRARSRYEARPNTASQELLYFKSGLGGGLHCVQVYEWRPTGSGWISTGATLDHLEVYHVRTDVSMTLHKRSDAPSHPSRSKALLIALPLVLSLVLLLLLLAYWRMRKRSLAPRRTPTPFLERHPSTNVTPSLPMQEYRSTLAYTFSDEPFLDMKEDSPEGGTLASNGMSDQMQRDALSAFRLLSALPPPTPPPKDVGLPPIPADHVPTSPVPPLPPTPVPSDLSPRHERRTSSWARLRPDLQSLKTKASNLSSISFARRHESVDGPPRYNPRPAWAGIPPMLISPASPGSPMRIRPLPPLPTSPVSPPLPTSPMSLLLPTSPVSPATPVSTASPGRPLLPNRLGEVILDPDRIIHEPLQLARALDAEADLSPPPYYWHRVLI